MRNILLTISYDGTRFCGWQRQDTSAQGRPVRTVQAELETALARLHKRAVALHGSGRTDSGVHAAAQAANFLSPIDSVPVSKYPVALNCLLPDDIRVMQARVVEDSFNARFSATSRTYRYFISHGGRIPLATQMPYRWCVAHKPDIANLNAMAACLRGEIDCATFAAGGDQSRSTCRYIEGARFFEQDDALVFEIAANAFLWRMVRSITGSLIYFDKSKKDADFFRGILSARDRRLAGPTAPARGLFLWSVSFDGVRRHV